MVMSRLYDLDELSLLYPFPILAKVAIHFLDCLQAIRDFVLEKHDSIRFCAATVSGVLDSLFIHFDCQ
jgi:hypothetical protein